MTLGTHLSGLWIVQVAASLVAASRADATARLLTQIDEVLLWATGTLLLSALLLWTLRRRTGALFLAPVRPNRLREDALAIVVIAYLLSLVVMSMFVRSVGMDMNDALAGLLVGGGAQLGGIVACLVVAASRFEGGIRRFCLSGGRVSTQTWVVTTVLLTVVAIGLCPFILKATVTVIEWLAPQHEISAHPTITALHETDQTLGMVAILWLGAVGMAPIAEEVFFRGLLQTFLMNVFRRRGLAIVVASLVFALAHLQQPHAVPALVVLAILIGLAYERTGSLVSPIVIHATFNLKTLIWDTLGAYAP